MAAGGNDTSVRFSAAASERVRRALTESLLSEASALPGAWSLLLDDCGTWRTRPPLSRELLDDLRAHFGSNVTREILLAAAGVKLSRTCLSDARLAVLFDLSGQHGFAVHAGADRFIHHRDSGKGGSANAIERVARPDEEGGLRNVYIAADAGLAAAGAMLEEAGDDENFGLLLGIPACCREAYICQRPKAAAAQNDFVLLALDNTPGPMPYDFWVNYPATYFGPGLLSFFPCSFRCANAAAVASSTFEMLHSCNDAWADEFLRTHRTNILYTEYEGLHLFRQPLIDGAIHYGPADHRSTEPGRVSDLIAGGTCLEVRGKHRVRIYRGSEQLGSIDGEYVGLCAFH